MDNNIILGGIGAVPIIAALVQIIKTAIPLPTRVLPLLTLAAGMAWQNGYSLAIGQWEPVGLLFSVVVGLSASGLYSATKGVVSSG